MKNEPRIEFAPLFTKQRKAAPLEIKQAFRDALDLFYENPNHAAVPGEPLSDVISICYILGFRKDNTKFFNKLSLNRRHF